MEPTAGPYRQRTGREPRDGVFPKTAVRMIICPLAICRPAKPAGPIAETILIDPNPGRQVTL
jgi:hypothetical protein